MTDDRPITSFSGPYRFLSNFWAAPIDRGTERWPTSEHLYQGLKTVVPLERQRILLAPTPGAAKRLGRTVTRRSEWSPAFSIRCMQLATRLKFEQHPDLAAQLVATAPRELIEGNTWNDRFWGQCPLGTGSNHLGILLMSIRSARFDSGLCCMARHAAAVPPWTCDCPCHVERATNAFGDPA